MSLIGTAIGNYVVRDKIGEGGMGAVYVAEHNRLGRRVAVKVLLPHMSGNQELLSRFFNEAKAATDIKNEHIVDVLDFGELPGGSSYIVMEWLEGQSLSQLLRTQGRLSRERTAHIAQGIGEALGAAHAHGIVHRDLKPDNVFLIKRGGDDDFVKVLDFGIAKLSVSDAGDVRTQAGALLGTPYYMSPEQCNGSSVDRRTDIYAMGVMLYQMLTGHLPFSSPNLTELLIAHATLPPPPMRSFEPSIWPTTEAAVMQALEKDPNRRFASIEALARAIGSDTIVAATTQAPSTPVLSAPRSTPPSAPTLAEVFVRVGLRGRGLLVTIAGVAVLGVVLLALALRPNAPTPTAVTTPSPLPVTSSDTPEVTHWKLKTTTCRPSPPAHVETTRTGTKIVSQADGMTSKGSVNADGTFTVHNSLATCTGTSDGKTVDETCTSITRGPTLPFIGNIGGRKSCRATYSRED